MGLATGSCHVAHCGACGAGYVGGDFLGDQPNLGLTNMKLVIIESPYAAETAEGIRENVEFARRCVKDSLSRGEAPIASHLLYTQPGILDDTITEERQQGIDAGLAWRDVAEMTVVYIDRGISDGMIYGLEAARKAGVPIEIRILEGSDAHERDQL